MFSLLKINNTRKMKTLTKLFLTTALLTSLQLYSNAQTHNAPDLTLEPESSGCTGRPVTVTVNCNSKVLYYYVDYGDDIQSYAFDGNNNNILVHNYTKPGTYTISVKVKYDEDYTESEVVSKTITVSDAPVLTLSDNHKNNTITAKTDIESSFKWFNSNNEELQTTTSELHYLENDIYKAVAISSAGCADTASIEVKYYEKSDSEPDETVINVVNNVITPGNLDGINDVLYIQDLKFEYPCIVRVYDKRGKLVFSSDDYSNTNGFQGLDDNGNELFAGTYYYVITSQGRKGVTGFVDIIR